MKRLTQHHILGILFAFCILLTLATPAVSEIPTRLTKIRVGDYTKYTRIVFDTNKVAHFSVDPKSILDNKGITIVFPRTITTLGPKLVFPKIPFIQSVITRQVNGTLHVTLHLSHPYSDSNIFALKQPNRIVIDLFWPQKTAQVTTSPTKKPASKPEKKPIRPPTVVKPPQKTTPAELKPKKPSPEATIAHKQQPEKAASPPPIIPSKEKESPLEAPPLQKPVKETPIQKTSIKESTITKTPPAPKKKQESVRPAPPAPVQQKEAPHVVIPPVESPKEQTITSDNTLSMKILSAVILVVVLINLYFLVRRRSASSRPKRARKIDKLQQLRQRNEEISSLDKLIKDELDKPKLAEKLGEQQYKKKEISSLDKLIEDELGKS